MGFESTSSSIRIILHSTFSFYTKNTIKGILIKCKGKNRQQNLWLFADEKKVHKTDLYTYTHMYKVFLLKPVTPQ